MHKTITCPACGCINAMPAVDKDGADLECVSCKFPYHLAHDGKLTHAKIAGKE